MYTDVDAQRQYQLNQIQHLYKVKDIKLPTEIVEVPANKPFTVVYVFQNTGDEQWPEDVEFICESGKYF